MDPAEIEFIAEDQNVEIIPKFNHLNLIHLISGDVGPFRAGIPAKVPLWLAINLKQRQKCRLVLPTWMNLETLTEIKEEEKKSRFFIKMPSDHYMEMSHIILDIGADDIPNVDLIRTLIKDIWDLRISKLRSSIDTFVKSGGGHATLNHLTQFEINSIRNILCDVLDTMSSLKDKQCDVDVTLVTSNSQSQ
ncbi:DNA replication complex GINS protein PSF2-like [Diaphorina citri]|uniref:DNA replication complex GINS protein PSF2 n=1 Tax=Diaphorina citri TaxID=121845 RepID=A0A1S4EMW1_DIACI|nr:DNA replication complex GINS protein PSF2-like [Diaphorina citri]XP_026686448.1 DNA replication complex GINS protein PSF2-like [Diaphorina citri]